jgi:hypothetical protein
VDAGECRRGRDLSFHELFAACKHLTYSAEKGLV